MSNQDRAAITGFIAGKDHLARLSRLHGRSLRGGQIDTAVKGMSSVDRILSPSEAAALPRSRQRMPKNKALKEIPLSRLEASSWKEIKL